MNCEIIRLDHKGRGITYINNKITFVKNALPGEIVNVEIKKENSKLIEADVIDFIKMSDMRQKSECPYFKECGGCDLLHMPYKYQLEYKQHKIIDIMKKFGNINPNLINNIVESDEQFFYRNKITLKVKEKIGYYKEKSYELIPIDKCLLVNEKINYLITKINEYGNLTNIKEIVIKSFSNTETMLIIYLQKSGCIDEFMKYMNDFVNNIVVCDEKNNIIKQSGKSNVLARLDGKMYYINAFSFFQVNLSQTIKIYNKIEEYINEYDKPIVCDLYCGTGSIGIFVSDNISKLHGIEIIKEAIENAKENAKLNNVENAEFEVGDTKTVLMKNNYKADIVIVDPPRAGLDKSVIEDLIRINPEMIIYLSCDPITLARDLNLIKSNYEVVEITPYDMFPNTHHVETLVKLAK